jgi:cbb3-type cytochrome c oxidase subunit III
MTLSSTLYSALACLLTTAAVPSTAQTSKQQQPQPLARTHADLPTRLTEVQANPQLVADLTNKGRRLSAICANCHGEGGNSVKPEIPNLAGQNPTYLVEQMRLFSDGTRRFEFMEGMIKAMSTDEKLSVVLFYASQSVTTTPVKDTALVAKGKGYFDKNCFRCHGTDGRGNNTFARIAGQQAVYLTNTLKRYRSGNGARTNPLMADNTRLMSDTDIDAVVAYVSSLQ